VPTPTLEQLTLPEWCVYVLTPGGEDRGSRWPLGAYVHLERKDGMGMPSDSDHGLSGVGATLLFTVYARAVESRRPDALLHDEFAESLVEDRPAEFSTVQKVRMDEGDQAALILRNLEFDRQVRGFLRRHAHAVVVHVGCGLDQRFQRVDDGEVDWYDLDLDEVIRLRRRLLGVTEGPRYHLLSGSVLESRWMDAVQARDDQAVLLVAEGVFMYLDEAQVRQLVLALRERFPGSELVFDAFSPLLVRANNLRFRMRAPAMGVRYSWGLRHPAYVERWADGVRLLEQWSLFDHPEPRLAHWWWMRRVPALAHIMGIFHYRLGESA
jgi:O-methyltransferase involved in polyketide biosynthesis